MYFGSKILISEREMTPSQHAQTQENRKKKNFFLDFLWAKIGWKNFSSAQPLYNRVQRGGGGAASIRIIRIIRSNVYIRSAGGGKS